MSRDLARLGDSVIVPHPVITSGRKLRAYSAVELTTAVLLAGPVLRRFFGARPSVWYGERREDPDLAPGNTSVASGIKQP